MIRQVRNLLVAAALTGLASAAHAQTDASPGAHAAAVRNVVLVHGAFADGSGWRGVYDRLTGLQGQHCSEPANLAG